MTRTMATTIRHLYMVCCTFTVARWQTARSDDRGAMSTEGAIITGLLALGAIAIMGIIVARATNSANNIPIFGG